MKKILLIACVAASLPQYAATMASQPWVTNRIAEAEARIVAQIPSADLTPATNYVNDLERRISDGLLKAGTAGQADRAYEADTAGSASRAETADMAMSAMSADGAQYADSAYTLATTESGGEDYRTAESIFQQLDNAATKSALNAVSNEAALVTRLFTSSNVILEVTNYNSVVNWPKIRILQLNESNEYITVWTETNGLTRTANEAAAYTASATNALAQQSAAAFAPKAWSGVTSGMGVEAPANTTWLSTPTTVIAGGYEPEKWITSGGAVWLITSKGATYDFSPSTNNTAYLNISASDGTPMFRIEKTDSYLLPVHADAVSVDGSTLVVDFDLVSSTQPYARVCTDLTTHNWAKEEDGIPAALSTVTWTQTSGGWRCRLSNNTGGNSLFGYFEYLQEGGTKIINEAVMDVGQGILCTDGVHKVRPVYNNGTITWEVVP